MITKDTETRIVDEFSRQLAAHGLSDIKYEAINWCNSITIVVPDAPKSRDKTLAATFQSVMRSLPDCLDERRSSFGREDPEEEDLFDDEDIDDDTPPEIAAQLAALPRFPIDDFDAKIERGVPYFDFWAKPQFVVSSEEEAAYDRRDEERGRLEDLAFGDSESDDDAGEFEFLPIPPPPKTRNTEVYLTMAYEPYDDIEKGEKVTEFREYNEYYVKKLLSQPRKTVRFQRGYGGPHHDAPRQMRWTIKNIEYYNHYTRESCPIDNPTSGFKPTFIALDLGERID